MNDNDDNLRQARPPAALEQGQVDRRQSRRSVRAMSGRSGLGSSWSGAPVTSPCSISPSTASCAVAMWSPSASTMWPPTATPLDRATVRQKKTGRPVRFELTEQTRQAIDEHLADRWQAPRAVPVRWPARGR